MRTYLVSIIVIMLNILASACSPAQIPAAAMTSTPTQVVPVPASTVTPTATVVPTAAPLPDALIGTYMVTFTKEELAQAGVTEHELCENAGTHEITLTPDGWSWKQTPLSDCGDIVAPESTGTWGVTGDQITFNDPAAFGCGPMAKYTWKLEAGALSFAVVEDGCPYRVILLTTHPWIEIR